jgi:hypothetical protein
LVINLKTYVYGEKSHENHEYGLRFHVRGTLRDSTGFIVPQKRCFFGIKYMFPWLICPKKPNPTSYSAFSGLTGCQGTD